MFLNIIRNCLWNFGNCIPETYAESFTNCGSTGQVIKIGQQKQRSSTTLAIREPITYKRNAAT